MQELYERLRGAFARRHPGRRIHEERPASEAELARAEAELGVRLPDDVRALYRIHNGVWAAGLLGREDGFAPLDEVVDTWRLLADVAGGERGETDSAAVRPAGFAPGWIPITTVGAGDAFCVDLDPGPAGRPGQIIWVEHGGPSRLFVAGALEHWLQQRVQELSR